MRSKRSARRTACASWSCSAQLATGAFDHASSDLHFIVDLGEYEKGVSRRYFAFCESLESLVQRPVDVITVRQIENPYFRAELEATKELILYDAEAGEAAS